MYEQSVLGPFHQSSEAYGLLFRRVLLSEENDMHGITKKSIIFNYNPKDLDVHGLQVKDSIEVLDNVIFLQRGFTVNFGEADRVKSNHLYPTMN